MGKSKSQTANINVKDTGENIKDENAEQNWN